MLTKTDNAGFAKEVRRFYLQESGICGSLYLCICIERVAKRQVFHQQPVEFQEWVHHCILGHTTMSRLLAAPMLTASGRKRYLPWLSGVALNNRDVRRARLELLDYMDAVSLHNGGSLPTVKEMLDARKTIEFGGHSPLLSDLHARIVAGAGTPAEATESHTKTD